jgi:hypothetical protein
MGTRGAVGFRIDGADKLTYSHFDSYPDALGEDFVKQVREMVKDPKLAEKVRALAAIEEGQEPTAEDIERCKPYTNLSVSKQSTKDWYCLTRGAQGNLAAILEVGKWELANEFINESLFCEWAYILNLDDKTVEFYRGFNKDPKAPGRYAAHVEKDHRPSREPYCGCKLLLTFPMDNIPKDWLKKVTKACGKEE